MRLLEVHLDVAIAPIYLFFPPVKEATCYYTTMKISVLRNRNGLTRFKMTCGTVRFRRICSTMFKFLFFPSFQRIPLDFLTGGKFREAAENYIQPLLRKVLYFSYCYF